MSRVRCSTWRTFLAVNVILVSANSGTFILSIGQCRKYARATQGNQAIGWRGPAPMNVRAPQLDSLYITMHYHLYTSIIWVIKLLFQQKKFTFRIRLYRVLASIYSKHTHTHARKHARTQTHKYTHAHKNTEKTHKHTKTHRNTHRNTHTNTH